MQYILTEHIIDKSTTSIIRALWYSWLRYFGKLKASLSITYITSETLLVAGALTLGVASRDTFIPGMWLPVGFGVIF